MLFRIDILLGPLKPIIAWSSDRRVSLKIVKFAKNESNQILYKEKTRMNRKMKIRSLGTFLSSKTSEICPCQPSISASFNGSNVYLCETCYGFCLILSLSLSYDYQKSSSFQYKAFYFGVYIISNIEKKIEKQ